MRKVTVCIVLVLSLFSVGLMLPLQATAAADAELGQRMAKAATEIPPSDLPERFVLGTQDGVRDSGVSTTALSSASSYPSSCTWMEGKIPYFHQPGGTPLCGHFAVKQVLWWWGHRVHEVDLDNYWGFNMEMGPKLEEIDGAFVHFLGSCQHTYGTGNKDLVKNWIHAGCPVICAIHAPGTPASDEANHVVTLFGWDDTLNGGSWLLTDTRRASAWSGANVDQIDVWVPYTTFDTHWNIAWNGDRRGMASALPGDRKYPVTTVHVFEVGSTVNPSTFTYEIWLVNYARTDIGEGDHGLAGWRAHGVFIELIGAEFVSADVGSFDEYQAYDTDENARSLSGATIVEFYTGTPLSMAKGFNVRQGHVTIRPTSGHVHVQYRGWIRDEDERAVGPPVEIDDDRLDDLTTTLMEPRAFRDPYDVNFQPNFLDYFVHVLSFDTVENPVLTSPTHTRGQVSTDQVLTVEWATPYAHGGVGGYSYVLVNQDDPYWNVNRTPDDTIDLDGSATSFTTSPLEPGHVWEFNIKTIGSNGEPAQFYSSFWVQIESATVTVYLWPHVYEVGEWLNVMWEQPTYGGLGVGGAYDLDTVDLFKGSSLVMTVVSDWPSGASEAGFPVPDVEPGTDYTLRVVLGRNAAGDQYPYLPEEYIGFSPIFAITAPPPPPPIVVDVVASDPQGQFSVTIDAGAAKGEPVTSCSVESTTNILSCDVVVSPDGMQVTITGQLADSTQDGQIVLTVDPVGVIIRYEINIAAYVAVLVPTIESSDSIGTKKDIFNPTDDLYAVGTGYSPSTSYDIYVVEDVAAWIHGVPIPSRVSGTATSVSSDPSGNIPPTLVWSHPLVLGRYDIVIDVNGNGVYDEGVDALDDSDIQVTAGFFVIPEVPLGTIVASTAMILALVAYAAVPRWRRKRT